MKHSDDILKMIRCAAMVFTVVLAVVCFSVTSFAEKRVVDLNSGAGRGGSFVMTDEHFTSVDGKDLRVTMSGLKEGNRAAVLKCLSDYYSTGSDDPIKIVDESFVDAEKWDVKDDKEKQYYNDEKDYFFGYDAYQCWAATCSNMLWLSGWAKRVNEGGAYDPATGTAFTSEDDVFNFYTSRFEDKGNDADRAIDWFFMGQFFINGPSPHASPIGGTLATDGLLKSFVSSAAQMQYDLAKHPEEIRQIMRTASDLPGDAAPRAVFQASVGTVDGNELTKPLHSLTAAGLITDPNAAADSGDAADTGDIYKAIILIDSDNDGEPTDAEREYKDSITSESARNAYKNEGRSKRPNSYTIYKLKYNKDKNGDPYWEITGYYKNVDAGAGEIHEQTCALYNLDALPVYDSTLEQNYTETEGTTDLVTNVDLTMDSLFTTGRTASVRDPYTWDAEEANKTRFTQGEAVNLNYFLSNRSNVDLDSSYPGGNKVTVDWTVTSNEDGKTVAEGTHIHAFEIFCGGGVEVGDIIKLAGPSDTAKWTPGSYTVTLAYNKGKEVEEAYYLNNIEKQVSFTITKKKTNTLRASGKTVRVSARKLKKKAKTIRRSDAIKVSSAKGDVTYTLKSVTKKRYKKYFTVKKKGGKIRVKKGLKKGKYKLRIKVTAAGNGTYLKKAKTVTVTIKVR